MITFDEILSYNKFLLNLNLKMILLNKLKISMNFIQVH